MINILRSRTIIVGIKWDGTISGALEINKKLEKFCEISNELKIHISQENSKPLRWMINHILIVNPGDWIVLFNPDNVKYRHLDVLSEEIIKKDFSVEFYDALDYDLNQYGIEVNNQDNTL